MLKKLEDLFFTILVIFIVFILSIGFIFFFIMISPIFIFIFLLFVSEKIYEKISG